MNNIINNSKEFNEPENNMGLGYEWYGALLKRRQCF